MEEKLVDITERLLNMEASLGSLQEEVKTNQKEIVAFKAGEKQLRDKLEVLANNSRRNRLRVLSILEGIEEGNLKSFVVVLLTEFVPETAKLGLEHDIQKEHRNPFRKPPEKEKPRKILINFRTYTIKELILSAALRAKQFKNKIWRSQLDQISPRLCKFINEN